MLNTQHNFDPFQMYASQLAWLQHLDKIPVTMILRLVVFLAKQKGVSTFHFFDK